MFAGLISPGTKEEKVVRLKKGDAIAIKAGTVSWWFNGAEDNSLLDVVFLGKTNDAQVPGQLSYQFFAGANGSFLSPGGFSEEFLSKVYNLSLAEAKELGKSQLGTIAIKLHDEKGIRSSIVGQSNIINNFNFLFVEPDLKVEGGGYITTYNNINNNKLDDDDDEIELCGAYIKLEPNAAFARSYVSNPAVQAMFVAKGKRWVQVVDMTGKLVLDNQQVEAGSLFLVPKFHVFSMVAGKEEGVECLSIMTCSKAVYGEISSMFRAMEPGGVTKVSLNVSPSFDQNIMPKISNASLIIPPASASVI